MSTFIELKQTDKTIYINPRAIADVEIFQGKVTITFPSGKTIVIPASNPEAEKVLSTIRAGQENPVANFSETKSARAFKEAPKMPQSTLIKNLLEPEDEPELENPREVRGRELAAAGKVEKRGDKYFIEEILADETLVASMVFRNAQNAIACNCDDFIATRRINAGFECEHILAVKIFAGGQAENA